MNKNITFQPIKFWAKIPHGIWLREATSVAVDSKDNVYIYNRGNIPLLIFNSSGDLISNWGNEDPLGNIKILEGSNLQIWEESKFIRPHSVRIDSEDNIWCVDDFGHKIYKFNQSFELLLTLGDGNPSERESGIPFNRPTDVAIRKSSGEIFVSDGYGNSRIHHFDYEGKFIKSWGI